MQENAGEAMTNMNHGEGKDSPAQPPTEAWHGFLGSAQACRSKYGSE